VATRSSIWKELGEGLRYVFADPRWRAIDAHVASWNFRRLPDEPVVEDELMPLPAVVLPDG
jgi:hypothetical protein